MEFLFKRLRTLRVSRHMKLFLGPIVRCILSGVHQWDPKFNTGPLPLALAGFVQGRFCFYVVLVRFSPK